MPKLSDDLLDRYVPVARAYLIRAAREHRLVTYMEISKAVGGGRGYIGQVLDAMNLRENDKQRPLLSALVVSARTRMPSSGFFVLLRSLRNASGPDKVVWQAERDRVWAFDWPAE